MPTNRLEPPYFPIVYVRGYAGSDEEVEDTVADPFMGFNLGSTKLRQTWDRKLERFYFESPLIRLMKDHGYRDVYHLGDEMPQNSPVAARSVFIYRYYDKVSDQLGLGVRGEIEDYAAGLSELIHMIRERICRDNDLDPESFRVYLVAHSMGGLVCRCFLQNPAGGDPRGVRGLVDKVFTYATPHKGIDLEVIGNIPAFFTRNNADNFRRERMRQYLALSSGATGEDSLDGKFDPDRFFCLVGTNHRDYVVAGGWARRIVGPMSDGLVRIANATVQGPDPAGTEMRQCPRAFVHRSHSGHYGIVNSEEGYQNLTRFLFGSMRVDGVLEVQELTLPPAVERAYESGETVRASYHFEIVVRVRRARWDLHRRLVLEDSAIFRSFDEMLRPPGGQSPRYPHLFSQFLADWATKKGGRSLGFSVDLGIRVPEYEINKKLWLDEHYEGGYLFRDKVNLVVTPPAGDRGWRLSYGVDSRTPNRAARPVEPVADEDMRDQEFVSTRDGDLLYRIPLEQTTRPGFRGALVLRGRAWR